MNANLAEITRDAGNRPLASRWASRRLRVSLIHFATLCLIATAGLVGCDGQDAAIPAETREFADRPSRVTNFNPPVVDLPHIVERPEADAVADQSARVAAGHEARTLSSGILAASFSVLPAKDPIAIDVHVDPVREVVAATAEGRVRTIQRIVGDLAAAVDAFPARCVVLRLKDCPLSFVRLNASDQAWIESQYSASARRQYETSLAELLESVLEEVNRIQPQAVVTVLGLPVEPGRNDFESARRTNERYQVLIDRLGSFVSVRSFIILGSSVSEVTCVEASMPEAVRLWDGRPIVFRTNGLWRVLCAYGDQLLVAKSDEDRQGWPEVGEEAGDHGQAERMLTDDPFEELSTEGAATVLADAQSAGGGGPSFHDGGRSRVHGFGGSGGSGGGGGGAGGGGGSGGGGGGGNPPDADGDGTPDDLDGCPFDPSKVTPGVCGCGTPDVDSDGDLVADCIDGCPSDPGKVSPGACGCNNPETDSDGDGTPNCVDGCPGDPNKDSPGDCGCGQPDIDSDDDGAADCIDGCPNDPNKTSPGLCGCGNPDVPGCGGLEAPPEGYSGSTVPNLTVILPQIVVNRTSGEIPFAVHASAMNTTASGSAHPYDELEYTWGFGDITGEVFVHPVTGAQVTANSDQIGPEAAYVYKSPGTFTITLSVRGWTGEAFVSASTSVEVTALAWAGADRYLDPVAGNDQNSGVSPASAWQSWSMLSSWVTGGDGRRALIRRGTIMWADSKITLTRSRIRFGTYGTGSAPILRPSVALNGAFFWLKGDVQIADIAFSDLVLDGGTLASSAITGNGMNELAPAIENIVFVNLTLSNDNGDSLVSFVGNNGVIRHLLLWQCDFQHGSSVKQGLFANMSQWLAVIGGSFSGGNGNNVLDHHIYGSKVENALYRWIDFQPVVSKNFCINNNAAPDGTLTEHVLVDGCDVTGTSNGIDWGNATNDPSLGQFSNVVVQNCAIHDLGLGGQSMGITGPTVQRIVVRDNLFYGNEDPDLRIADPGAHVEAYRNNLWKAASSDSPNVILFADQTVWFFDNVVVNESQSSAAYPNRALISLNSQSTIGYLIDRNVYWAPNLAYQGSVKPFLVSGDRKTFGEWVEIGFDPNGAYGNPGWSDPTNGDF